MVLQFVIADESDLNCVFDQCRDLIDRYEDVSEIDYQSVLIWVLRKLKENVCRYIRVVQDGVTVGYFYLRRVDGKLELDDFYVLPEFRGRGIGSEVLRKCLSEADCPVFLYVFAKNTGAIRLYQRFGFEKIREVGTTRWIMEWNPVK